MVFASCGHHDEPEHFVSEKTILVYMPYTGSNGNLYKYFQDNIRGIKQSLEEHGFGNNNVLVYINEYESRAHLIQLHKNTQRGEAIMGDTLMTFTTKSPTTSEAITEVIAKVKELAPARQYGMIIGSHGQGWLPAEGGNMRKNRWFGSGTAAYQTDLCELATALKNCNIHLQFALFDCCYMACIENVYEMRDAADYYIASTSEVMNDGVPYSYVFHYLMLPEPNYEEVVNKFHDFYTAYPYPYGTFSVSNCKYAEEMATLMRQINSSSGFDNSDISEVQDLDAAYFTPTVYFDFGSYVDHCCKDENLLSQYHTLMNKLVPYKAATEKIMSDSPRQFLPVKEFSGLTISDPSENFKVVETKLNTPWWKATH